MNHAPEGGPVPPEPGEERKGGVSRSVLVSLFLRSLTIQGSWNYRTMIGGGFAFTMLPLLRHLRGPRGQALESSLARHSAHFNSHPYLANVAVGAVARLELDGERAEVVDRFKSAVRGPLGGIGDTLIWAGWLPATLLVALTAGWAGMPRGLCVLLFLVLYNTGHLTLRIWAFAVGFREGASVGARLRDAGLGRRTEMLLKGGSLMLGVLSGFLLVSERGLGMAGWLWPALASAAFALGLRGGFKTWRPAALAVVGAVSLLFLKGALL